MLTGDFNLNSIQRYTDSHKEVLKQKILEHESILRRQVHELHRLYRIQQTLMDDLSWKEFNRYTSWTISTQSTPITFQDPPKQKPVAEAFSTWPVADLTQTANWYWLKESQGAYTKLQQRSFDLQLPADDYLSHVGTKFPKKESCFSLKGSTEGNNFLYDTHISNPEEVKLSLSTGKDTNKGSTSRNSYVIDLEKPIERVSNEEPKPKPLSSFNFEALTTYDKNKHSLQIPIPSDPSYAQRERKDLGHKLFMNCSVENCSEAFQEWKPLSIDTGLKECCHNSSPVNPFNKKQQSTSYDRTRLDLNRVLLDESSCFSNAHVVTFPSSAESSSGVLQGLADESPKGTDDTIATWWRKPNNHCSSVTRELLQQEKSVYSTLTDSREKYTSIPASDKNTKFKAKSRSEVGLIDLESMPDDLLEPCEDFGNNSVVTLSSKLVEDHLYTSKGGGIILSQTPSDAEIGKVCCEKSEEDTVSSSPQNCGVVQDVNYKVSPAGTEDKHELRDSNLSAFEEFEANQLGSQFTGTFEHNPIVEASVHAYLWDCNYSKMKDRDYGEQQQEATETDDLDLVRRAAETLIHISLENSICSRDCFANAGSEGLANEQRNERPQCSSDSFESIVLKLKETSVDEYSLTSELIEVNETENQSGVKLRRGRRLKDFQRDILPGLMSLSRQEICEDIYSIGVVSKSNEFRKNRSKKFGGRNWIVPMRGRRSRFS